MLFDDYKNEKKQRFFAQMEKARNALYKNSLYEYIDGVRYCYNLSYRYDSVNLKNIIDSNINCTNRSNFEKLLKCGILKPYYNTYDFDKEKAASLQNYILEHSN